MTEPGMESFSSEDGRPDRVAAARRGLLARAARPTTAPTGSTPGARAARAPRGHATGLRARRAQPAPSGARRSPARTTGFAPGWSSTSRPRDAGAADRRPPHHPCRLPGARGPAAPYVGRATGLWQVGGHGSAESREPPEPRTGGSLGARRRVPGVLRGAERATGARVLRGAAACARHAAADSTVRRGHPRAREAAGGPGAPSADRRPGVGTGAGGVPRHPRWWVLLELGGGGRRPQRRAGRSAGRRRGVCGLPARTRGPLAGRARRLRGRRALAARPGRGDVRHREAGDRRSAPPAPRWP